MAISAATNAWTRSEDALASALPKLAAFRTLTGETTEDAAARHVHWYETDEPQDGTSFGRAEREERGAIAIVGSDGQRPYALTRGDDSAWYGGGRLQLVIERPVPKSQWRTQTTENESRGQVTRWFENCVGELLEQLVDYWLENQGPFVSRVDCEAVMETLPEDWDAEGRLQCIVIVISYGLPQ